MTSTQRVTWSRKVVTWSNVYATLLIPCYHVSFSAASLSAQNVFWDSIESQFGSKCFQPNTDAAHMTWQSIQWEQHSFLLENRTLLFFWHWIFTTQQLFLHRFLTRSWLGAPTCLFIHILKVGARVKEKVTIQSIFMTKAAHFWQGWRHLHLLMKSQYGAENRAYCITENKMPRHAETPFLL